MGAAEEDNPFLAGGFGLIGERESFQGLAEFGENGITGDAQNEGSIAAI